MMWKKNGNLRISRFYVITHKTKFHEIPNALGKNVETATIAFNQ